MELSVTLSRDLLDDTALEINDHVNYYVAEMGDNQTSWRRQTTSSPWIDGTVTTQRSKENITRSMSVEVLGENWADTLNNAGNLIAAVSQDNFTLTINMYSTVVSYICEASDYSWTQSKERWHSNRGILTVSLIHKPNPISGII